MTTERERKLWRAIGILGFIGMELGILVIVLFVPMTFIIMGVRDSVFIAEHCASFKRIVYWTTGIGGLTFLFYSFVGLGALLRRKGFTIFSLVILVIHFLLIIGITIWGSVPHEARKDYLNEAWKTMNETTIDLIHDHFSCCGFNSYEDFDATNPFDPMPESCYAFKEDKIPWPEGCYEKVVKMSNPDAPKVVNSKGETIEFTDAKTSNPFAAAFIVMVVLLFLVDGFNIFACVAALMHVDFKSIKKREKSIDILTIANDHVLQNRNGDVTPPSDKTNITSSTNDANGIKTIQDPEKTSRPSTSSSASSIETKDNCMLKLANSVAYTLEEAFFWFGLRVGKHPKKTILLSLIFSFTLMFGLLQRDEEENGAQSFLPSDLQISKDYVYYLRYFSSRDRTQQMLIIDKDGVLKPETFKNTLDLDKEIKKITSKNDYKFEDICQKFGQNCKEKSVFELWSFDYDTISALTEQQVLDKINEQNLKSPVFYDDIELENIIGGLKKENDRIIGAEAHLLDFTTISVANQTQDDWEDKFIELAQNGYKGLEIYMEAESSRRKLVGSSYTDELPLLFAGFFLVFLYISLMTGKFSLVRHRVWIALLGVATAGLSLGAGIGLSASITFKWSVLHLIGPFLIIGIGVDDMFVLLQACNTVNRDPDLKHRPVHERAAFILKSAGVSITITSLTDLVAFAVGASSQIKAFESFSIYTAICIIILFILQCTFFLACVVLDERRREAKKDACICCYQHSENYQEGRCAKRELFQRFFEDVLAKGMTYKAVKVVAILVTLALSGFMAWGFYNLKVGYDPDWYIPQDSYIIPFHQKMKEYFSNGVDSAAYVINADFYAEQNKLTDLYEKLQNNSKVDNKYLKSWYEAYKTWPNRASTSNEFEFAQSVANFTRTPLGLNYLYDIVFNRARTKIVASKFPLRHSDTEFGIEEVAIMDSIREDIDSIEFSGQAFPYGRGYFNFEVVKIIQREVYRNIGITMLCVFIMVLPMIASIQMSLWVVLCVILTIIDVAGTMHFIGLYIETSTIITLLLTVGLAVDYAAHIAHKYMTLKGSRNMRMRVSLSQVGPAVFNGGFSTFLALALLAGSQTYSYKVFFTIFTCVVWYGLWNGLIFLPAVLSIIGPSPHSIASPAILHQEDGRSPSPTSNKIENEIQNPYTDDNSIERS